MTKQHGLIKLEGTIEDISFYKRNGTYCARRKGGVSGNRIARDPSYARTRENNNEFGRAGKASKLIRQSLGSLLQPYNTRNLHTRLVTLLLRIIKTDNIHARGQRTIQNGELGFLQGFEFNEDCQLGTTIYVAYGTSIDRATGILTVQLPELKPISDLVSPSGATHFQLVMAGMAPNFDNLSSEVQSTRSAFLSLTNSIAAAQILTVTLTNFSDFPLVQILGIEFFQEVNGQYYPLNSFSFNALKLIGVSSS
ncbi:hypothetical protein NF867_13095 [Solitalea sp. MAHUQ-68]|uniref:Uncharacterized protein n=1 Tax=Solitalea agri TaxID=2953739 RepID=A0A9X2JFU4_9SPHI|nr:hypothetical protein [Solitalea agri]MCO4293801.1 hypothetical protein [Solitalea agri]